MKPRTILLSLAAILAVAACQREEARAPSVPAPLNQAELAAPVAVAPAIADFYRADPDRRLWVRGGRIRPEAQPLAAMLAEHHPESARDLLGSLAAAEQGNEDALGRAELLLTAGLVRLVEERRGEAGAMTYAEAGLAPAEAAGTPALLAGAAAATDLRAYVARAVRTNPVLDALSRGSAGYRRRWSSLPQVQVPQGPAMAVGAQGPRVALLRRRLGLGQGDRYDAGLARAVAEFKRVHGLSGTGGADEATIAALNRGAGHYEAIIRLNMARARAIPAEPGRRFVLVDTAAARLWMFDNGAPAGTMRVIVGKQGMETPMLAGRLRYAMLNPYWNVPVDLARDRARRVLREGTGVLARERLQILSQFHADDRVLRPASVNWRAVAAGREPLRLRQLPGGANVMGAVKFMLPNNLDIYLHDFPDKSLFAQSDRRLSSGCVRLEDAPALARWLFGGTAPVPQGARPEQRVDLPEPVPVYISYFTAVPAGGGIVFQADTYGRDTAALATLAEAKGRRRG